MTKGWLAVGTGMLVVGLAACGGGGDGGVNTPTPLPTPPTKAEVTFNVDPNPVISEYQGDGWYRFKVNLELYDTAGVGFTINTVRTTVSSAATGTILLDYNYSVAEHVDARGRTVLQFTSRALPDLDRRGSQHPLRGRPPRRQGQRHDPVQPGFGPPRGRAGGPLGVAAEGWGRSVPLPPN